MMLTERTHSVPWIFVIGFMGMTATGAEPDRYEAAREFVRRTESRVVRDQVSPQWLEGGRALWYRVRTGPGTTESVHVDVATGVRKSGADLRALGLPPSPAQTTSSASTAWKTSRRTGEETELTFLNRLETPVELFWINEHGEARPYGALAPGAERRQHTFGGHVWLIATPTGERLAIVAAPETPGTIEIDGPGTKRDDGQPPARAPDQSPDGRWELSIVDGHLRWRDVAAGTTTVMLVGDEARRPMRGRPLWSPDSRTCVVSRAEEVPARQVTIVESSPRAREQPVLKTFPYRKPGDPLPQPSLVLVRVTEAGPRVIEVARDLHLNPFTEDHAIEVTWAPDGSECYFDDNERGHQRYRILAVDAETGTARVVVEETSATFIDYAQKTWRHWLPETGELLWMSERDGWCHVYLYDIATGTVKGRVTAGDWPVREVLHVDATRRELWFLASGLRPDEDPYHRHLCRVNFDGTGFAQLTAGDGDHRIEFAPDRESFVARWSRVDQPPVHELRRARDGGLIAILETADATALYETGWRPPERFVAPGRDGTTPIHGILIKPSRFDPAKRYPVVEQIYAGPHGAFVPKTFGRLPRQETLAELGFVIVQIDGMGTNHRGKAFHDVCWRNLQDAGFPDRIAWLNAAAKDRPWMDLSRVGIYGGSAGGQSAMRALLDHHELYKVAVADCGCHDNRMDKIWWNEQWLGWPVGEVYAQASNRDHAHRLQGALLLIVGELDTNVDPASTFQVVGALQRAGKPFEFMPLVNEGHGAAESDYGSRLRAEFLLKHLRP